MLQFETNLKSGNYFSTIEIAEDLTVEISTEPSRKSEPVEGKLSFYGTQKFDIFNQTLSPYIVAQLAVPAAIVTRNIHDICKTSFPKTFTAGKANLMIESKDLENPIGYISKKVGDKSYILNVYKAKLKMPTGLKLSAPPDATITDALKRIGMKSVKVLGKGSSGMVYDCGDHVVKVLKSTARAFTIEKEHDGNKTVSALLEEIRGEKPDVTTVEEMISLSDLRVYELISDKWEHIYPFYVMRKSDKTLNKVSFKGDDVEIIDHSKMKECIRSAALAIKSIHDAGIAHFDIKPENIGYNMTAKNIVANPSTSESFRTLKNLISLIDFGEAVVTRSARLSTASRNRKPEDVIASQEGTTHNVTEFVSEQKKAVQSMSQAEAKEKLESNLIGIISAAIRGTPMFMAPEIHKWRLNGSLKVKEIVESIFPESPISDTETEQAKKNIQQFLYIGRRSDIYSFGASILDVICKTFDPKISCDSHYDLKTLEKVKGRLKENDPKGISRDWTLLLNFLTHMLAEDPQERYTIGEVLEDKYLYG